MGGLDGKVAIVSGGARGQGAAEAGLFAREGASVVLGDILDEEGMKVGAKIRELGGQASYLHLDVTQEEDWRKAVELAENTYGRLDILVNNAGITLSGVSIEDLTEEQWDRIMAVNAKGPFLGTKHSIPAMRRAGGGSIINTSSMAGIIIPSGGRSNVYAASKGAVRLFTKATAIQHAKDNIRCNSIHPGPINTPGWPAPVDDPEAMATRLSRIPLGKYGVPDDIAYLVLYLASDESSYVTGAELVIDGGFTAQ